MLGRFALVGLTLVALGAPAAMAGPGHFPIWWLKKQCEANYGEFKTCAFQFVTGNRNTAITKQTTVQQGYVGSSTQFSVTMQNGNDNRAYTELVGTNQSSLISQNGNDNFAGIYLEGNDQKAKIVENGSGIWGAIGSTTDGSNAEVIVNY